MARRNTSSRTGFTAIELLIVLAIVGMLGALAASAVFRVRATSEKSATETTLTKLASALDVHWKAVIDAAKKEYDGLPSNIKQNLLTLADNATASASTPKPHPRRDDRARLLYTKFRLKQEFPTSFELAMNPTYPGDAGSFPQHVFLPTQAIPGAVPPPPIMTASKQFSGKPAYIKAIYGKTAPAAEFQSSALLLMALEQQRTGVGATAIDQMVGTNFIRTEGQFRYLVDSWGKPLQFYTYPTASIAAATDLGGPDPLDPERLLPANTSRWIPTMVTPTPPKPWRNFVELMHDPNSGRKMIPVIVSAGPDSDLGGVVAALDPRMNLDAPGAFDNIFSYRLRQTGARGD